MLKKKSKQKLSEMAKLNVYKKRLSTLFIVLLVIQVILFGNMQQSGIFFIKTSEELHDTKTEFSNVLLKDTIREQQRKMLSSIRQGWVQYLSVHPNTELMHKVNDNYVYSNYEGASVIFDPETMIKKDRPDNYLDIYDVDTKELIAEKVRPQWNKEEVKKILNIVASPVKAFGPSGDILIYDAFTTEVIINTSTDNKDDEAVYAKDGRRYLSLEFQHPNNKNPQATQNNMESLLWRRDTDRNSGLINFFNESTDMGNDGNNLEKFPLGQYDRDFCERIILPYESVGVEGQPMQISVILSSNEKEVIAPYTGVIKSYNDLEEKFNVGMNKAMIVPIVSVGMSLITIFAAMFALRINATHCKKYCDRKTKEP